MERKEEIILAAQDTTSYGKDLYGKKSLATLLSKLSKIKGIGSIRIMYAYIDGIDDEFISEMASNPKVLHYLDIPVQHGDDEVLKNDLFMKLAPTADDLWFWVMEKRQNIPVKLIPNAHRGLHTEVNRVDFWNPNKEGSLYYINEIKGKNDEQFEELLNHYGLLGIDNNR